jgi:hypothetical protein
LSARAAGASLAARATCPVPDKGSVPIDAQPTGALACVTGAGEHNAGNRHGEDECL